MNKTRKVLTINVEGKVSFPFIANLNIKKSYFDCPQRTKILRALINLTGTNDIVANFHIDEYYVESVDYDESTKTEYWDIGH